MTPQKKTQASQPAPEKLRQTKRRSTPGWKCLKELYCCRLASLIQNVKPCTVRRANTKNLSTQENQGQSNRRSTAGQLLSTPKENMAVGETESRLPKRQPKIVRRQKIFKNAKQRKTEANQPIAIGSFLQRYEVILYMFHLRQEPCSFEWT